MDKCINMNDMINLDIEYRMPTLIFQKKKTQIDIDFL